MIVCAKSVSMTFETLEEDVSCIPSRRLVVDLCRIRLFRFFLACLVRVKLLRFFEEDKMAIGCAKSVAITFEWLEEDVSCIRSRRLVVDLGCIHLFRFFSRV